MVRCQMPDPKQPGSARSDLGTRIREWRPGDDPMWVSWAVAVLAVPIGLMINVIIFFVFAVVLQDSADSLPSPLAGGIWGEGATVGLGILAFAFGKRAQRRKAREGWSPAVVGLTVVAGLFAGGAVALGLWAFSRSSFSELGSGG